MRVISQDGKIDVPYETTWFSAEMNAIFAHTVEGRATEVIGQYDSTEKAIEVLKMISDKYCQIKESDFLRCENAFFTEPVFRLPVD